MRIFVALPIVVALASIASAETSLEGKTITVTAPGKRYVPVPIAEDAAPGDFVGTSASGSRVPVTVVRSTAWMVVPPDVKTRSESFTLRESNAMEPAVKLTERDGAGVIDVLIHGEPFTAYHYSNDERKPYLFPVKGEGGVSVTRDWPLGEPAQTEDHPHHVSFWSGYGDINGHDYWEYGARTGWQRTESITFGSGAACGWIATHIVWEDKEHKPVIDERRLYRFFTGPGDGTQRLFDVDVRFTAAYGEVKFADTKEGGLVAVRIADALRERGGAGTITTSEGAIGGTAAWGKPAAWCDYSGTIEGVGARGLAVFDSPKSFRYPTHWHVRDYGLMGANPFGYSHFYDGKKNGDHVVKQGETLEFSFRIFVHSGDVKAADVAGYYRDFAEPPVAAIK